MKKSACFYGLTLFWAAHCLPARIDEIPQLPFVLGEKLEYELKWGFFPVGTARMEVLPNDATDTLKPIVIRFSVRTNSFADAFYRVRTSITSTIDPSFSRTLKYEKSQREGSKARDLVVEFDYKSMLARYSDKEGMAINTPIPGPVFDPLSIAYFFRLHPLAESGETFLPTCDGKRFRNVRVRAGSVERIKLPMGWVRAIGTRPALANLGGVFEKSPRGMLEVWYSDDERRVPVRVSSKVIVGSFTANLKEAYPALKINERF